MRYTIAAFKYLTLKLYCHLSISMIFLNHVNLRLSTGALSNLMSVSMTDNFQGYMMSERKYPMESKDFLFPATQSGYVHLPFPQWFPDENNLKMLQQISINFAKLLSSTIK